MNLDIFLDFIIANLKLISLFAVDYKPETHTMLLKVKLPLFSSTLDCLSDLIVLLLLSLC